MLQITHPLRRAAVAVTQRQRTALRETLRSIMAQVPIRAYYGVIRKPIETDIFPYWRSAIYNK